AAAARRFHPGKLGPNNVEGGPGLPAKRAADARAGRVASGSLRAVHSRGARAGNPVVVAQVKGGVSLWRVPAGSHLFDFLPGLSFLSRPRPAIYAICGVSSGSARTLDIRFPAGFAGFAGRRAI